MRVMSGGLALDVVRGGGGSCVLVAEKGTTVRRKIFKH